MDRQDAIRKIKAMRNPNGRTPEEAQAFRAKADAIQASHGILESELTATVFDFSQFRSAPPRPQPTERSFEAAEAIRKAREAQWMAEQVRMRAQREAAQQRAQAPRPEPKAAPSKKGPRRGDFQGTVPKGFVNPQTIRDLMAELGIRTNGDLARMAGVSASLVSEWMGKGRGRFVHQVDWVRHERNIRKAAGQ